MKLYEFLKKHKKHCRIQQLYTTASNDTSVIQPSKTLAAQHKEKRAQVLLRNVIYRGSEYKAIFVSYFFRACCIRCIRYPDKKNTQYDKNRERNDTCTVTRNTGRCGYGTYDES